MSAITPYEWAIIAFVIGVTFLCVFMLTVPLLLGGKSWGRAKQEQFESGVVSAGGARIRLSAKFYLVAIFFVVSLVADLLGIFAMKKLFVNNKMSGILHIVGAVISANLLTFIAWLISGISILRYNKTEKEVS